MKKRKNQYMKIILSPCKTCLIFPCCTNLCEEKIIFTSERIVRLATFYNIEISDVVNHKIAPKCLEDIWKENVAISKRTDNDTYGSMSNLVLDTFKEMKETIKQEILIEGPVKNQHICTDLVKMFLLHPILGIENV
jgi:hypothetical protein